MKGTISGVVGLVGVLLAGGIAQAQTSSLADLAREEQARRKAIKQPTRVYTNDDVRDVKPLSLMGQGGKETPAKGAAEAEGESGAEQAVGEGGKGAEGAKGGQSAKGATVGGGDEAQWRERFASAREQLSRGRLQLEAMRGRVGRLAGARLTATESELAQVQGQQQETLQEYDRLRADVERFERAIVDLEAQARQAGVPPGWVR